MTAPKANLINAIVLLLCSFWGYWAIDFKSLTALIPAAFGLGLLACQAGVRAENKVMAHIAVVLTVVVLLALIVPLRSALADGDGLAILRIGLMMLTSILATVAFIRSFRDARRARSPE